MARPYVSGIHAALTLAVFAGLSACNLGCEGDCSETDPRTAANALRGELASWPETAPAAMPASGSATYAGYLTGSLSGIVNGSAYGDAMFTADFSTSTINGQFQPIGYFPDGTVQYLGTYDLAPGAIAGNSFLTTWSSGTGVGFVDGTFVGSDANGIVALVDGDVSYFSWNEIGELICCSVHLDGTISAVR